MEKFLRRTRRLLDVQRAEAAEVVAGFQGRKDFDIQDWIKVISIKEVESASFYDPEAYAKWFAKDLPAQVLHANGAVDPAVA
ncbi:hypothetical protein [Stenotrophomonas sp. SORGH_AS_0282]|uniref:hypothetical protein n=1 Tax=Stenotrophomonas sp. SORGH_AS_0282 TaxID=3041763 RepID=UPI002789343B|nr:hypothetical protein [Stenotrophomonas sp. SORGH_AS_0282]MDQ1187564.1 hypothetical protein [Stenotrophomonas sp. SORGH_AS_0282]